MAIEQRRGCGFRKVGGIYLVVDGPGRPCDRLPFPLHVCPTCNGGIKQARGWTWFDVPTLFGGPHRVVTPYNSEPTPCGCGVELGVLKSVGRGSFIGGCPLCYRPDLIGRAGLIWIGEKFYPTVADFVREANTLGISRRIKAVPRGFKVGETWVLFAHPLAVTESFDISFVQKPGIFMIVRPSRIEKLITESQSKDEAIMKDLADKGITPVIVPDDDKDHQGTVYDKEDQAELELETA